MTYRAKYYFSFPSDDPMELVSKSELGEFYSEQDDIWKALDEARQKRQPIASALLQAFPGLNYVKHSEIEIHLQRYDAQLNLWEPTTMVVS